MKRPWKRTVYHRLVGLMIFIIFVTLVVPDLIFAHTAGRAMARDIQAQIQDTLAATAGYLEENGLPLEDIQRFMNGERIHTIVVDDPTILKLPAAAAKTLEQEGKVALTRVSDPENGNRVGAAVMKYKSSYLVMQVEMEPVFRLSRKVNLLSLLLSLAIGIVAAAFAGHHILTPVRRLDDATQRVAAGDFTIQLPLPKSRDEIYSLVSSFNTMTRELAGVELLRSNFVSDISHEFKTPLTAIEGYAKLLEGACSESERLEYLQTINEEARRLSTLADNILMLNRIEKGNLPAKRTIVRLDEQIRRALMLCEPKWSQKRIEPEIELEAIPYEGYEALLMQVWANLLDNAIKYSPEGGRISVLLSKGQGSLFFSVHDDGPGIPPDKQAHIFEKFYKADQSRGSDGNGLGLSIVWQVAALHGGSVRVESGALRRGSTFTVILPEQPAPAGGK